MRPEGRKRAGFFPTPEETLRRLQRLLRVPDHAVLFDPCAGDGVALAAVGTPQCRRVGIELNSERAKEARAALTYVVHADALQCRFVGSCDLLFLNSPFERGRLELQFLKTFTPALHPRGVLVHILSEPYLKDHWPFLTRTFEDLRVYRFPEAEYQAFQQLVVIARPRTLKVESQGDLPTITELPEHPSLQQRVNVPKASQRFDVFKPTVTTDDLDTLIEGRGVYQALVDRHTLRDIGNVKPLMPLQDGHKGQLLAAGIFDNTLIEQGDTGLIVNGVATKEVVKTTEYTEHETLTRETEVIRTRVTALDLDTAELLTIV